MAATVTIENIGTNYAAVALLGGRVFAPGKHVIEVDSALVEKLVNSTALRKNKLLVFPGGKLEAAAAAQGEDVAAELAQTRAALSSARKRAEDAAAAEKRERERAEKLQAALEKMVREAEVEKKGK